MTSLYLSLLYGPLSLLAIDQMKFTSVVTSTGESSNITSIFFSSETDMLPPLSNNSVTQSVVMNFMMSRGEKYLTSLFYPSSEYVSIVACQAHFDNSEGAHSCKQALLYSLLRLQVDILWGIEIASGCVRSLIYLALCIHLHRIHPSSTVALEKKTTVHSCFGFLDLSHLHGLLALGQVTRNRWSWKW